MNDKLRFWVWHQNSPVKLTLTEGQGVHFGEHWHNGEGWSFSDTYIEHCGNHLRRECISGGTDCDGRHETFLTQFADIETAKALPGVYDNDMLDFPNWVKQHCQVYDQFAQQMGY